MSTPTLRERELEAALERLLEVAEVAERIMRSGCCAKCGTEPVTADGGFDEDFALAMCSTEDWLDMHGAVVEADEVLVGVRLDRTRPGPGSLAEANAVRIELDLAESQGALR